MLSIPLGPLSLPVAPLLVLAAAAAAALLARRLVLRATADASLSRLAADRVWEALWAALVGARLGHLVLNAAAYTATPWAVLDIRDGGWSAPAGMAVGAAWLVWRLRGATPLRRPVAFAAAAGVAVWWAAHVAADEAQPARLPSLALVALDDGRGADLAQLAGGQPVVVNLWATWCAPCREEMPVLAAAQAREHQVRIVFVNQGEPAARVRGYLQSQGLALRDVWLDEHSRAGPAVGSPGLPTTLFYDAQGQRVAAHLGVLNAAALEGRLRSLRPPP